MAKSLETALENISVDPVHMSGIKWDLPPAPSPPGGSPYHQDGMVLPRVPRAHRGLALDEVPIIAQTGEGILNRGAMQRIGGAPMLNRLNAGQLFGGSGDGEIVIHTHVHMDGKEFAQAVDRVTMADQRRTRRLNVA